MDNQKQINELITLLDSFMEQGGGHMNIQVPNPLAMDTLIVETYNSTDCTNGNTACSVPTIHLPDDEE